MSEPIIFNQIFRTRCSCSQTETLTLIKIVENCLRISRIARSKGLASLTQIVPGISDTFTRILVGLLSSGADAHILYEFAVNYLSSTSLRGRDLLSKILIGEAMLQIQTGVSILELQALLQGLIGMEHPPTHSVEARPITRGGQIQVQGKDYIFKTGLVGNLTSFDKNPVPFIIDGDLVLAPGKLMFFPGPLIVQGSIKGGAIQVVGNLTVQRGIIGSTLEGIHSSGGITAGFIENSVVTAGGQVECASAIYNSTIRTGQELICRGTAGSIVGGFLAAAGVYATNVGSVFGFATTVEIGPHVDKAKERLTVYGSLYSGVKIMISQAQIQTRNDFQSVGVFSAGYMIKMEKLHTF